MKKEFLVSGVIVLILFVQIGFSLASNINVIPLRTNPYPAEPGQYMNIWIQIENTGNVEVNNFKMILEPEYPFSLYEGDNATRYIGTLKIHEPVVLKYKLYVDENAVEGWNDLKYKYNSNNMWIESKASIYISHKPRIELISVDPSEVDIGKKSNVSLTIKNMGHAEARNVKVKFDTSSTSIKTIGSDTKYVDSLGVNEEKTLTYKIITDSSKTGVELIPLTISYEDLNETQQSFISYVGINVIGEPEINVLLRNEDPKPFKNGKSDISVEVINSGPVQAKFVYINASTPSGIIEKNKFYIGDLDSDDFDIADFNVLLKDVTGKQPLYITVKYKTPEYDEREVSKIIYFNVLNKSENSSNRYIWIIIVVVILAGLYIWKRKSKK